MCSRGRIALVLEVRDLRVEGAALGRGDEAAARDPHADEDPDDQREEDGRQRRGVIAKVEHSVVRSQQSGKGRRSGRAHAAASSRRVPHRIGPLDHHLREGAVVRVRLERDGRPRGGPREAGTRSADSSCASATTSPSPLPALRNSDGQSCPRQLPAGTAGRAAAVGMDGGDPGPPVGRLCGSRTKAQTSCARSESSRLAADFHPPKRSAIRWPSRLDQAAQLRGGGDRDHDRAEARETASATNGSIPTLRLTSRDTPFASTRISPTLQPRQERRGHAGAVALEELDQVEVRPDGDDQLGALLVGEQEREVLADAGRGDDVVRRRRARRAARPPGAVPSAVGVDERSPRRERSAASETESMSPTITSGL